jgi:iron complex outermembrane receptor protein
MSRHAFRPGALPGLAAAFLSTTALLPNASLAQTPASVALPDVNTTATQPDVQGYQVRKDGGLQGGATRTDTPLQDVPQSVVVIPRQVIQEEGLQDRADVLRNVADVRPNVALNFDASGASDRVRGFRPEFYRDGLISFSDGGDRESLVGVDQIEVIKGPTGSLFGSGLGGGLGGVINTVSSLPNATPSYEAGIRIGSYATVRPYIDMNQPLSADGRWSARLQAEYNQNRSTADNFSTRRNTIIPALSYQDDQSKVTLQSLHTERRALDFAGLPAFGTVSGDFRVPYQTNVTGTDTPKNLTTRDAVTLLAEHQLGDVITLRLATRYAVTNQEQPATAIFGSATPLDGTASTFPRYNIYLHEDLNEFSVLPSIQAKFATGPVRHTVLAGIEASKISDLAAINYAATTPIDLLAPTYGVYVQPPTISKGQDNHYNTVSGFVQEQADWQRLHFLFALRGTGLDVKYRNLDTSTTYQTQQTRVDPRVGLALDVLPGVTIFSGYGSGARVDQSVSPTVTGQALRPETGDQVEVGVKLDLGWGLSGQLALFDIHRQNVAVADPNIPFNTIQTGEQRSRGFDTNLVWQPMSRLSVLLAYAYLDAQVTKDTTYAVGTRLPFAPAHSGRLFAAYRVPVPQVGDVVVGAGAYATTSQAVDLSLPDRTPGFATFDTSISWQHGPLRLNLQVQNLLDKKAYVPFAYLGDSVAQIERRSAFLTASVSF